MHPCTWLKNDKAEVRVHYPLGLEKPTSVEKGVVMSASKGRVVVRFDSGRHQEFQCAWRKSHANSPTSYWRLGDLATRRPYPELYAPSDPERTFGSRRVEVDTYSRGYSGEEVRILWIGDHAAE